MTKTISKGLKLTNFRKIMNSLKEKVNNNQIIKIQRMLKSSVFHWQMFYKSVLELWENYELSYFSEIPLNETKIKKKSKKIEVSEFKGFRAMISSVPVETKMNYIRKNIKKILKNEYFFRKIEKNSTQIQNINNSENFKTEELQNFEKIKHADILKKFSKEMFYSLIKKSLSDQTLKRRKKK